MVSGSGVLSGLKPQTVLDTSDAPLQRPAGLLARIGGGVAVLGCATWVAVEGLPEWEERIFESLNGGTANLELILWLHMQ
ncbi:MAG: hypothetical protein ACR2OH_10570, partial [Microthrixaceae bacterium]